MKSELANKLKTILDNMSQDAFDKEWEAITAYNFEGPSFADAIEYFSIVNTQTGNYELNSSMTNEEFNMNDNYSLAA